jgi:hypothetical protein
MILGFEVASKDSSLIVNRDFSAAAGAGMSSSSTAAAWAGAEAEAGAEKEMSGMFRRDFCRMSVFLF